MVVVVMANNGIQGGPALAGTYLENGRHYSVFRRGKYMFPCDDIEMDRMDIYHKFFQVARNNVLHSAPLTQNYDPGPRILDLGTGTGIWAIDIADTYIGFKGPPDVLGIDLAWIQPPTIPPNLRFEQRDIDSPWHGMDESSWDLIHIRMLLGAISNWKDMYAKVFRHLKPEFGWLEHVEIDMIPRCDDGTLPPNSKLVEWTQLLYEATALAYRPMAYNGSPGTQLMLEEQGFVDISEEIIRVPLNSWPTEQYSKDVGRWYNLGLTQGLEALSLGPLTRMLGWAKADVDRLCSEVKREVCNKNYHVYCNMHIWIARRPADA